MSFGPPVTPPVVKQLLIAIGVVYNTARISLDERSRELATLRVIGLTRGEVSAILLGELAATEDIAVADLNGDGAVNELDRDQLVFELFDTTYGDSNLDGEFNSGDLVQVLASGTYEVDTDAVWTTGDFQGDGRTNSSDQFETVHTWHHDIGHQ